MKHEFNINLKLYNSSKLEALPVQTHFTMSEGGDSVSYDDLPQLEDPDEVVPEPYPQPDFFTRTPYEYGPSERDIEESRARISRLGKPFEVTPSRSSYEMVDKMQTPKEEKIEDVPDETTFSRPVGDEKEPEDEEEPREKEEGVPQASNVTEYFTTSKKITTEVIIDALREYNKKHPDNPIAIPPQARGEYDYVYRANLNSIMKAHNIVIYKASTPIAVPPSDSYDKMQYTIEKMFHINQVLIKVTFHF